jgi:putative holliday junction resolvase
MRILGIDYGSKKVGLALSDDKGLLAFPHSVIANTKNLLSDIVATAQVSDVRTIVIGESRNYKGSENRIMDDVHPLIEKLRELGYEVVLEPEMLSSHQAAHFQGKTAMIDAAAASIILQSYIDRMRFKSESAIL